MKLTFDEVNHIYRLDGVIIPGYSEISRVMGIVDLSHVPSYFLEPARKFGEAGHFALRFWDKGTLDEEALSESLKPCLEEYRKSLKKEDIEILPEYIEKPICSYLYRYGNTPDRICLVKGELSVLELKFVEKMEKGTALQTACQKIAAEEYYKIKIKKRYGLQIPLKGECKLHPYKDKSDEHAWLCFLGAYNWRIKNGKSSR